VRTRSADFNAHYHETLAVLRAESPVAATPQPGEYYVSRYDDVYRVLRDSETFSSAEGVAVDPGGAKLPPIDLDPPLHTQWRSVLNRWFTRQRMAVHEPAIRATAHSMLDEALAGDGTDLVTAYAGRLPTEVFFAQIMRLPREDAERCAAYVDQAVFSADHEASREGYALLGAFVTPLVTELQQRPPEDELLSAVAHAEIDGRKVTTQEAILAVTLLILGGLETTAGALGQFVVRFCREPEIPARLRAEPDLLPTAIEELLRLDPPFIAIARTATRDTEIGGHRIEAGQQVLISFASANRDEGEFACPHAFDPDRSANRHLSFGAGPHRCAGSNLARMNLRIALEELLARVHDVRLAEGADPIRYHSVLNRSPVAVPIEFTPGRRSSS
jgi:cytochrome P450